MAGTGLSSRDEMKKFFADFTIPDVSAAFEELKTEHPIVKKLCDSVEKKDPEFSTRYAGFIVQGAKTVESGITTLLDALSGATASSSSVSIVEVDSDSEQTPPLALMENLPEGSERNQRFRWNRDSERHESKIQDLLKESELEKEGSLYFCREMKYLISPEGSAAPVYVGLSEDGLEVAIKVIPKDPRNSTVFENELQLLQDMRLESPHVVHYVTFVDGKEFYFLANKLCDYDLEEYILSLGQKESSEREKMLRKVVTEVLTSLQVLHHAGVIHRDLKPRNVLIDALGKARLADFGISRRLEEGRTSRHTERMGTLGWEASEILIQNDPCAYKRSSDIQVAGMLVHYILSEGKHPFGDGQLFVRQGNIASGTHNIAVADGTARHLIEWMIQTDPLKRPTVDTALNHPFFWDEKRIKDVLHNLGNLDDVQNYESYSKNVELYDAVREITVGKSFFEWREKVPVTWPKIGKTIPNDLLGLLRYIRNTLGHHYDVYVNQKVVHHFPDFLISLHTLAEKMKWSY